MNIKELLTKKLYKPLIAVGIIIQLLIAVTTYHPDLRAFVLSSSFINKGEITTFYDHVSKLDNGSLIKKIYGDDIFIYPPLAYLIPATIYAPLHSLFSSQYTQIIERDESLYQNKAFDFPMLFFKAPFLIFSFLTLILIGKIFKDKENSRLAQLLWLFNPINLLVAGGMAQADSILVFFLTAAILFLKKEKYLWASLFIGLSALIKPIGLALIPLIAIWEYKNHGLPQAIKSAIPGFAIFALIILPFLSSPAFKMYALMANLTSKSVYAGIDISSGTTIPWFFIFYFLIALFVYTSKLKLIDGIFLAILSSLAFNHFHPQWFLWMIPWFIVSTIETNRHYLLTALMFAWAIIWLSFDPSLHLGMFLVLKSDLPPTMVSPLNGSLITLLARSFITASLIFLVIPIQNNVKK